MPLYVNKLEASRGITIKQWNKGKNAIRLLDKILLKDKRSLDTREGFSREYKWTSEERKNY